MDKDELAALPACGSAAPVVCVPNRWVGSLQHFWHMSLGLLLPLFDAGLAGRLDGRVPWLLTQGPMIDPLLAHALPAVFPAHRILSPEDMNRAATVHPVMPIERWDEVVDRRQPKASWDAMVPRLRRLATELPVRFRGRCACRGADLPRGAALVLERSPQPAFYAETGDAEIKGYGLGRRSLANAEACAARLRRAGWQAIRFEPGAHCYGCQIRAFRRAGAIVAIRGAELANLVWAQPGTRVHVANPLEMRGRAFVTLAELCGLKLSVEPVSGRFAEIDIEALAFRLGAPPPVPGDKGDDDAAPG